MVHVTPSAVYHLAEKTTSDCHKRRKRNTYLYELWLVSWAIHACSTIDIPVSCHVKKVQWRASGREIIRRSYPVWPSSTTLTNPSRQIPKKKRTSFPTMAVPHNTVRALHRRRLNMPTLKHKTRKTKQPSADAIIVARPQSGVEKHTATTTPALPKPRVAPTSSPRHCSPTPVRASQ